MIELIWLVSFFIRDIHGVATAAVVPMAEVLDDIAKVHEFAQSLKEFYRLVTTVPVQRVRVVTFKTLVSFKPR